MKAFGKDFILFIALAFSWPNTAPCADTSKFVPFIVSNLPPTPLDSAKAKLIKDGMTLKMLVATLGPGWVTPYEGVGVIRWRFADGRQLNVLPHWDDESEIITYKGHDGLARMWW